MPSGQGESSQYEANCDIVAAAHIDRTAQEQVSHQNPSLYYPAVMHQHTPDPDSTIVKIVSVKKKDLDPDARKHQDPQ